MKNELLLLYPRKNIFAMYSTIPFIPYYSSLQKGNVKAFLHALAALYLLNLYYRNDSWVTNYQDISKMDYSIGSSIFTVKPPVSDQLWYGNNAVASESPYVVNYQDTDYQRIKEMQDRENTALNDYWKIQPELREPAFVAQLNAAFEKEKLDPHQRVMPIWELAKYRLNKKIPKELPFEERKSLLVGSQEWSGWVHQHNKHLSADKLTEENLQQEIDSISTLWGIELIKQFEKLEWIPIAMNSNICRVYIP